MRASVIALVEWMGSLYGDPPEGTCAASYAERLAMVLEPLDDRQIEDARWLVAERFLPTQTARWPRPERFIEAIAFGSTVEV